MIAFDTDVLSAILASNAEIVSKAIVIPIDEQYLPIVVVEETIRGRLQMIRQAESAKAKISLERAYFLLQQTFFGIRHVQVLPYTSQAEIIFQEWRHQKIRVGTHDMRIAAICVANQTKLITRNRRDYERIPGLDVEFWE